MADHELQPDDPALAVAARHALHDEELIAALAVDGDAADDPAKARGLIERCVACRDLHADLVSIGAGLQAAGSAAAAGAVRPAPRDFRLTVADADRLRPGFRLRRLDRIAARLMGGIAAFGRPVGATLATFGLVGLLVGSFALGPLAVTPASAPGDAAATAGPGFEGQGGAVGNAAPTATDQDRATVQVAPLETGLREETGTKGMSDAGPPGPAAIALLFAGSLAVLVLGVALFAAAARSRRRVSIERNT